LLNKTMARGRHAQALRKQTRVAHSNDETRGYVSMLRAAIFTHKAAAEAGDFEPEPHDLALWAVLEDA
jgi:hypothetical protein